MPRNAWNTEIKKLIFLAYPAEPAPAKMNNNKRIVYTMLIRYGLRYMACARVGFVSLCRVKNYFLTRPVVDKNKLI